MCDWKEKYFELMFSKNPEKIDLDAAFDIKKNNLPNVLYKYQDINDYSLKNLYNDTLYFRNASDFNDPYDSALTMSDIKFLEEDKVKEFATRFSLSTQLPKDEVQRYFTELPINEAFRRLVEKTPLYLTPEQREILLKKLLNAIKEEDEKFVTGVSDLYQRRIYATCFSEIPNSMLMWSHYANNHKGMVLEYDFNELYSKEYLDLLINLHPIFYTNKLLNLAEYDKVKEKIFISTLAAISKSDEWEYENEWRIIIKQKFDDLGLVMPFIKPKGIILGARVDEVKKLWLYRQAKETEIPIKEIKIDRFNYILKIEELII